MINYLNDDDLLSNINLDTMILPKIKIIFPQE